MSIDYFPLGLALNEAFCNRTEETKRLLLNIEQVKPTLIMSPRRYGKTSLALNTIHKAKLPFAYVDFFSEYSASDIEKSILKAIGQVISIILPTPQKALKAAQEFFSDMKIKFAIHASGASIEFDYLTQEHHQLKNVFLQLDLLAQKYKKKVILFMDEFQRLSQIDEGLSIEANIRFIAQQSKNIIFIFSGSNRHLLQHMFEDKNRPFYKLCDRVILERIETNHYLEYIDFAAKKRWHQTMKKEVITLILTLTEHHPYYVNLLCSRLWLEKKIPSIHDVIFHWDKLAAEDRSQIGMEMDLLTNNQRKLLIYLARHSNISAPTSKEILQVTHLSLSSISASFSALEQKDYIYRDKNGCYQLIDPLMKKIISSPTNF